MRVLRIYTGDDGESHFEELDVPLNATRYGSLSGAVPVKSVMFRETPVGGAIDFHNAPQRQFVVNLTGLVEIETGDGTKRRLGAGDILLADDTTGRGHITRDLEGPRHSLFLPLAEDFDVATWRQQ
jgi:hypothetical protein